MLALYNVAFLAAIAGISSATPPPLHTALVAKRVRSVSEGMVHGSISCVEPNGRIWAVGSNLTEGVYTNTEGDDLLEVDIDLEAATKGPVPMRTQSSSMWSSISEALGFSKRKHHFVGAISLHEDQDALYIGPGVGGLMLGATDETGPSMGPTEVPNSAADGNKWSYFAESDMWVYDPQSNHLIPHWVNPDGSIAKIRVYFDEKWRVFTMTGGPLPSSDGRYHECSFTFNPL